MRSDVVAIVIIAVALASGCSSSRLAVRQAIDMSIRALPAYDRETDVEFGEQAVAGQIKMLEGLLESAPNDPELLLALTRAYSRYAYGFTQLRIDCAVTSRSSEAEQRWTTQAADFFARAETYGHRLLKQAHPDFHEAVESDSSALARALGRFRAREASALFWSAFARGNRLAHQPPTSQTLFALGRVAQVMHRVVELDERVGWGSAHLYLASYYSRLPVFLGGDRNRAEKHFARAREIDSGLYLPGRFLEAEFRWRVTADTAAYVRALRDMTGADPGSRPEQNLDHAVARRQAAIRLWSLDESYGCPCPVAVVTRAP